MNGTFEIRLEIKLQEIDSHWENGFLFRQRSDNSETIYGVGLPISGQGNGPAIQFLRAWLMANRPAIEDAMALVFAKEDSYSTKDHQAEALWEDLQLANKALNEVGDVPLAEKRRLAENVKGKYQAWARQQDQGAAVLRAKNVARYQANADLFFQRIESMGRPGAAK